VKKVLSFVILIFSIGINVNSVFATNLISNNYFESDYDDFWSDYTQAVGDHGLVPEKTFAVDSSASDYRPDTHFDAASPHEGTNFFMANGSNVTTDTVWQTNSLISVAEAGTTYRFEAYICSLVNVGGDPYMAAPDLAFELGDGTTFLPFTTIEKGESTTAGEWYLVYADGKFDTPGNYYLRLMNAQSAPVGNDFGLDSVYFGFAEDAPTVGEYPVDVVDEPDTSTMAVVPNIVTKDPSYTVSQLLNNEVGSTFEGGVLRADTVGKTLSNVFTVLATNGSIDTNGYDLAVSGDITGSGGLAKIGDGTLTLSGIISNTNGISTSAGTLILSGANTYTGNTTVNGGTLKLGAAGVIADVSALIVNGTFDMNSYSEAVGSLAGSGTVTSSAAGLMTLTAGEDNTSTTFSGIIEDGSGTVSLAKAGAGTLTLSGSNTYTGTTAVNAGTLQVGKSNAITTTTALTMADVASAILDLNDFNQTIGSLAGGGTTGGNVTLGSGTLAVGDATSTAYAGIISETGSLVKQGAGTLTLSGSNTYTGTTSINSGVISCNTVATSDSAQSLGQGATVNLGVAATSSGTLKYTGSTGTLDKAINALGNGSDTIQNSGAGVLTLSGIITKDGTILTLKDGEFLVSGKITGASADSDLIVDGSTVTLTNANNDYNGPTIIQNSGKVIIADDYLGAVPGSATAGNLEFNSGTLNASDTFTLDSNRGIKLTGAGTIDVDTDKTLTYGGIMADSGAFTKAGAGTLTLSATNTYTGGTTVSAGTLYANNNNALGSGDVTSNAILNVGLNTVDIGSGVYTQSNGSTLQLTANSDTEYGSIKSTGDAVATAASTVNVVAGGYINNKAKLTVLDTGSGSSIVPANITTTVTGSSRISFDPSVVGGKLILTADRSSNGFESCGKDENSKAVGNVLDNMTDYTTDMKSILDTLETMSDSDAGDALNTMESPVNRGIIETGRLSIGQSISSILNHFSLLKKNIFGISTGDDVSSDSKFAKPAEAVWAKAFGTYAKQDNRKGIEGYHADIMGGAFGLDFISTNKTTFGLGCGYLYNKIDPEKVSLSRTTADSIQGLLYYGYNHELNYMEKDALYLNLIGSFAYNMYDSKRNINIGTTINRQAKADYDGQQYTAYGEVGYYIPRSKINLIPLASLEYSRLEVDSYTENGADSINLYVNRQHYDLLELGLGLKFSSIIKKENIDIIPEIRGKWLHDFIADKAEVTSRFTGGGASFKTVGAEPAKSVFDVGATLTLLGKNNIKLDLDYDFYIRDDFYSHNGAATLKYRF